MNLSLSKNSWRFCVKIHKKALLVKLLRTYLRKCDFMLVQRNLNIQIPFWSFNLNVYYILNNAKQVCLDFALQSHIPFHNAWHIYRRQKYWKIFILFMTSIHQFFSPIDKYFFNTIWCNNYFDDAVIRILMPPQNLKKVRWFHFRKN